eukprot:10260775-Ditylum_brightwellii.AAC.1
MQRSWAPHGVEGWYLGPTCLHYCCYWVHINKAQYEQIADTVEFSPQKVKIPKTVSMEAATHAALDLIDVLNKDMPASPFLQNGDKQQYALRELANIFQTHYHSNTHLLYNQYNYHHHLQW